MLPYEAIVVGAGPAGLFAAARAAAPGCSVLVLEKQAQPGRKLLLTGSGQCNFTHAGPIQDFLSAYGDHGRFLKPALYHFTNQDAIDFFQRLGVESMVKESTGKVFPKSCRARDLLNALLAACRQQKVEIRFQQGVTRIKRSGGRGFLVSAGAEEYAASRVLIATGGKSYPSTGSTGDGYGLARSLGHSIADLRPGLTPFFIRDFPLASLAGTAFKDLPISLWRSGGKIKTKTGDLLLTHKGLSGPVVHNLARYAAPGDQVTLALAGAGQPEQFRRRALAELEQAGKLKISAWMKRLQLTQALTQKIMALARVQPAAACGQLSRDQRQTLLRLLLEFPLTIKALGDFDVAMVTCGGVSLAEVNPKTMESRLVPGLYFAGEVLDIDGDSGGYDLQAAWSTAALASAAWQARGITP